MRAKFKNKLSILLLMLTGMMSNAWAQAAFIPGSSTVEWELTGAAQNLILTISGTGEMPDFAEEPDRPWNNDRLGIRTIIVDDGVTGIGNNAFAYFDNLTSITLPNSGLTSIGNKAFTGCSSLTSITLDRKSVV